MLLWFGSKEYAEMMELVNSTRQSLDECKDVLDKNKTECKCGVKLLDALEQFDYNQKYEKTLIEYQDNFNDLLHRVTNLEILVNEKINVIDHSWLIRMVKYIM